MAADGYHGYVHAAEPSLSLHGVESFGGLCDLTRTISMVRDAVTESIP